jgi:hypothetical protein
MVSTRSQTSAQKLLNEAYFSSCYIDEDVMHSSGLQEKKDELPPSSPTFIPIVKPKVESVEEFDEAERAWAKVHPWEALAKSGNTERRRIWTNNILLDKHKETCYGQLTHHEGVINELLHRLDREREMVVVIKRQIDQSTKIMELDGTIQDPNDFDPEFLDMYCHAPVPPRKIRNAQQYRALFRRQ